MLLQGCYQAQPWSTVGASTRSKLVPLTLRKRGYARFQRIAEEFGIRCLICACKNPDMTAHQCTTAMGPRSTEWAEKGNTSQLSLFAC
jgi:hypothetical protein